MALRQFVLKNFGIYLMILAFSCGGAGPKENFQKAQRDEKKPMSISDPLSTVEKKASAIVTGANRTGVYLPYLQGKQVGLVGNQTSVIFKKGGHVHLVDSLLRLGVNLTKVFSPEHGFRGTATAGETVKNGVDQKTGLPIISLYGSHKKPTPQDLKNVDILIFDIQDVGLRFYTYISTLHYVMAACAENGIPLLVFDRPNPNGGYIDGPILDERYKSFIGMDPVPVVHGMTIGEYAKMINGEGWLHQGETCDLTVIKMENYSRDRSYDLPIKPSPNLPNAKAVNLYPSLCFFEGTNVNAGRGTNFQFQVFGSPYLDPHYYDFQYTPEPNASSRHPKHEGELCYGKDLRNTPRLQQINLKWLIEAYRHTADRAQFFKPFFTKLAGTKILQQQIEAGKSAEEIKASWKEGLQNYDAMRKAYLLY